jgi:hypothetical protein
LIFCYSISHSIWFMELSDGASSSVLSFWTLTVHHTSGFVTEGDSLDYLFPSISIEQRFSSLWSLDLTWIRRFGVPSFIKWCDLCETAFMSLPVFFSCVCWNWVNLYELMIELTALIMKLILLFPVFYGKLLLLKFLILKIFVS